MAIIRESPRVFNSSSTGGIVSGSSGSNLQFGFLATYLRVENLGSVDLWAKFNSTGIATTSDILIRSCAPARVREFYFDVPAVAMVSLAATSTGTTSGASVHALGLP